MISLAISPISLSGSDGRVEWDVDQERFVNDPEAQKTCDARVPVLPGN
jgi:hypothetical protein